MDGRTETNKTISVPEYDGHEQTILPPKPIENQKQGETKYFLFDKEKKGLIFISALKQVALSS